MIPSLLHVLGRTVSDREGQRGQRPVWHHRCRTTGPSCRHEKTGPGPHGTQPLQDSPFDRHIEEITAIYDGQIIFSEELMRIAV